MGHASRAFKCPIFRNHKHDSTGKTNSTKTATETEAPMPIEPMPQRPGNLSRTARKHANTTERTSLTARRRNIIMMMGGGQEWGFQSAHRPIHPFTQPNRNGKRSPPIDRQPLTWVRSRRGRAGGMEPGTRHPAPDTRHPASGIRNRDHCVRIVKRMSTLSTCLHPNLIPR